MINDLGKFDCKRKKGKRYYDKKAQSIYDEAYAMVCLSDLDWTDNVIEFYVCLLMLEGCYASVKACELRSRLHKVLEVNAGRQKMSAIKDTALGLYNDKDKLLAWMKSRDKFKNDLKDIEDEERKGKKARRGRKDVV